MGNIEVRLPDEIPTVIKLNDDTPFADDCDINVPTEAVSHPAPAKTKKTKKTKAEKAKVDEAIAKLGIEPDVPNADDVIMPEVSEEVADIVSAMEGKDPVKKAPTKKRMFGQ